MITIKQLSDELGVSKEAIRKRANQLAPTCYQVGTNRKILINPEGEQIIRDSYNAGDNQVGTNIGAKVGIENKQNDAVYEALNATLQILKEQLKIKDEQIKILQDALQKEQQNTNQAQQLNAADKYKAIEEKPKGLRRIFSKRNREYNTKGGI